MVDQSEAVEDLWAWKPGIIRQFLEMHDRYNKLAEEVSYILEKDMQKEGIEYSTVTYRSKTLNSFCEKVVRKKCADPLREITDLAGVRITYLYSSDKPKIERLVERGFQIVKKIDKVDQLQADWFGYGALHYLVKLGKRSSGARYDDLKDLVCELQVRTILQDAWAVVAHHLSYKKEADIPKELSRKLNALAGLFETADGQFDRLREERMAYAKSVKGIISSRPRRALNRQINLDNLYEYLKWRFPRREEGTREAVAYLLNDLQRLGCQTLADVEANVRQAEDAIVAFEKKYPPRDLDTGELVPFSSVGAVRVAFEFTESIYRDALSRGTGRDKYKEFQHLVKSPQTAKQPAARRRGHPRA